MRLNAQLGRIMKRNVILPSELFRREEADMYATGWLIDAIVRNTREVECAGRLLA